MKNILSLLKGMFICLIFSGCIANAPRVQPTYTPFPTYTAQVPIIIRPETVVTEAPMIRNESALSATPEAILVRPTESPSTQGGFIQNNSSSSQSDSFAPVSITPRELVNGGPIQFGYGETSAVISGVAPANGRVTYSIEAMINQTFIMVLSSTNGRAVLGMSDDRGAVFLDPQSRYTFWNMFLPRTAKYAIDVCSFGAADEFTLQIIIPARLTIPQGKTKVSVSAPIKAQSVASFLIYAYKGQKFSVDVYSGATPSVFLRVSGMESQTIYLDSATMTPSWYAYAPQTQDYLIEVVAYDNAADYKLTVDLK